MDMVKVGTIQGTRGALFERANKKYLLYTLPFLFADIDQATRLIRSGFGEQINQGARANGFYVPATGVAGGFRQFTSNPRPIVTPDDMKGLKMRTPPIDSIIRTMSALGASPQQVPYGDTYMALKTNVVDGQENPCSNIAEMKFYEVQKYFTEVNYQIHPDPFFVNLAWFESLPGDLKAVFTAAAKAAMAKSDEVWLASEKDYQALLTQKLTANRITAENHEAFVAKVKPVWDYYGHHDHSHHLVHHAGGAHRGSAAPAGRCAGARCYALGNDPHGGAAKCSGGYRGRHHSGPGPRPRRDHGCHHGDWQPSGNCQVAVCPRIHHGQRAGQRIH